MSLEYLEESVTVSIPGRPVGKGRPRFGKGKVYTPEPTRNAENTLQFYFRQACWVPLEGPLSLTVAFCFKYPRSWSKARREAVEGGEEPWYMGKPDLDNLLKLVKDAGNGILWRDDAQVVSIEADKVYSVENQTIINVFSHVSLSLHGLYERIARSAN
tara:strand:+ start:274 stop:747 length:474 start_codon:yes stop_codon:yes gene_type:complete